MTSRVGGKYSVRWRETGGRVTTSEMRGVAMKANRGKRIVSVPGVPLLVWRTIQERLKKRCSILVILF